MPTELCKDELECLNSIYLNDITIEENEELDEVLLRIMLHPATGDDSESKYVTLTLIITLPTGYPEKSIPNIIIKNPRGLSEEGEKQLARKMKEKCTELIGNPMIFELIEMSKEYLTENNKPAVECPICLAEFSDADQYIRTACYHYFHSYCLGNYLKQEDLEENKINNSCPVCRIEFEEDLDISKLIDASPPTEDIDTSTFLDEWVGKREMLNALYEKQKTQGGIIDLTEKTQTLLVISTPSEESSPESNNQIEPMPQQTPPPMSTNLSNAQNKSSGTNKQKSDKVQSRYKFENGRKYYGQRRRK